MTEFVTKIILAIVLSAGLFGGVYYRGYSVGKESATVEYNQKMDKLNTRVEEKLESIEKKSDSLVSVINSNKDSLRRDFNIALSKINGQPLVVIEKGTNICKPTDIFIATHNELVNRVNGK